MLHQANEVPFGPSEQINWEGSLWLCFQRSISGRSLVKWPGGPEVNSLSDPSSATAGTCFEDTCLCLSDELLM